MDIMERKGINNIYMKFENTEVMNFKGAFRGLRNPLESWSKSDSCIGLFSESDIDYYLNDVIYIWIDNENELRKKENKEPFDYGSDEYFKVSEKYADWLSNQGILYHDDAYYNAAFLGPNDLSLAQRMIKAGSSDRKFLRQIMVSVDITAPLYWWKEFDTYKVGTVANSTSTMHKLGSTPITKECFEMNDMDKDLLLYENNEPESPTLSVEEYWNMLIVDLEHLRKKYNQTKDKRYWKELIRLLPESWLQTRTVTMNYEILRNMYSQRKNHRLTEWHTFCRWIATLPYANELILYNLD